MNNQDQIQEAKLAALQQAMAEYVPGSLFDHEHEADLAKIRHRALLLLDHRARSVHEMRTRLKDLEQFHDQDIEEVLEKFIQDGLLNDRDFASEWVRGRRQRRGKSRAVLNQELKEKGISDQIRAEALSEVTDDAEYDIAYQFAEKKARSVKVVPEDWAEREKDLRKVVGVLARRGFPIGMSMNIAREVLDSRYQELESEQEDE